MIVNEDFVFMNKFIHYAPRVMSIIVVFFFALFILEAFDPEFGWQSGLGHAALALAAAGVTYAASRWPKIGGWIFVAFGIWYEISVIRAGWYGGLVMGAVPIIIGALFLAGGYHSSKKS